MNQTAVTDLMKFDNGILQDIAGSFNFLEKNSHNKLHSGANYNRVNNNKGAFIIALSLTFGVYNCD